MVALFSATPAQTAMSAHPCTPEACPAEALRQAGYCVTSRKHRHASRIDRPDWREHMAAQHAPWDPEGEGMAWVEHLGSRAGDQYRRVYSHDVLVVSAEDLRLLPSSDGGLNRFMARETKRHDLRGAAA